MLIPWFHRMPFLYLDSDPCLVFCTLRQHIASQQLVDVTLLLGCRFIDAFTDEIRAQAAQTQYAPKDGFVESIKSMNVDGAS